MKEKLLSFFAAGGVDISNLPDPAANPAALQTILNIVFVLTGAIAVLIIVLAGFRFVTSSGDPQSVAKARNAIIYAIVGLIVIIFATVIVNFVVWEVG